VPIVKIPIRVYKHPPDIPEKEPVAQGTWTATHNHKPAAPRKRKEEAEQSSSSVGQKARMGGKENANEVKGQNTGALGGTTRG